MIEKSIEIYYDIADIPSPDGRPVSGRKALKFRNAAMELIESALVDTGLGEWSGSEIGQGEVNFGFTVDDFEAAERVAREAVIGTPYEGIRDVQHREFDYSEVEDLEPPHDLPMKLKVLMVILPLLLLPLFLFNLLFSGFRRILGR